MAKTIDLHTHFVPASIPAGEGRDERWPQIVHGDDHSAAIIINGETYRKIDHRAWDVERRLEDMAADKVDIQVLSAMPELLSTWFSPEDGRAFCEIMNDYAADMISQSPENFLGFAMVALQDPQMAASQLSALKAQGFVGVEIPTHVNGMALGDPSLSEFFAEAEAQDLAIMVHPLRPIGVERVGGPFSLAAAVSFPMDTTLAGVSLIANGVLDRHPKLRIMLSHGGGAISHIAPRLDFIWSKFPATQKEVPVKPSEMAATFFYDTIVYDAMTLEHLSARVGTDRLVLGSDYPFLAKQDAPVRFVEDALGAGAAQMICADNARAFLGLSADNKKTASKVETAA